MPQTSICVKSSLSLFQILQYAAVFAEILDCTAFVGQTYCVTVKDEREPRGLQTVSLSNMPSTTSNSSVIQYTPISAECQYFIPGMHFALYLVIFLANMWQCAVFSAVYFRKGKRH